MAAPEHEFCDAFRVFAPNEKAAAFILLNVRVNVVEMIEWLSKQDEAGEEFARFDVRVKDPTRNFDFPSWGAAAPYATVNRWTPKPRETDLRTGATPSVEGADDAF
jgi:hypothetical protein